MNRGGVELDIQIALIFPKVTESPTLTPGEYVGCAKTKETKNGVAIINPNKTNIALDDDVFTNLLKGLSSPSLNRGRF